MDGRPQAKHNSADSRRLHELWKVGLPPSEALEVFGSTDLVAEFRQSREQLTDDDRFADSIVERRLAGEKFGTAPEYFRRGFERLEHREKAIRALERDIVGRIDSGELVAIGFLNPAQTDVGTPRKVQLHVFDRRPSWSRNDCIEGNGLRYESVRIARADAVQHIMRKPGRPSRQSSILRAWERMDTEKAIDTKKPLSWHYPELRRRVKEMDCDHSDTGLDKKTLNKVVGKMFRELRARDKTAKL